MSPETRSRFLVGIDLGTIHTALAYVDLAGEGDLAEAVQVPPVPQLVAPGEVGERRLLPSSAYVPGEHELPPAARRLPWGDAPVVVGELARAQGARVPGHPLADQELVLTVPASFDEVARELTLRAAREAGLPRVTLLEEPQAAFYDFASQHRADLAAALGGQRLVLVCDVGGGTTDFTLIHVSAPLPSPLPASRGEGMSPSFPPGGDKGMSPSFSPGGDKGMSPSFSPGGGEGVSPSLSPGGGGGGLPPPFLGEGEGRSPPPPPPGGGGGGGGG